MKLAFFIIGMALAGCASTNEWRAVRIDGSSEYSFVKSVASLQKELPHKRREVLEMALAEIWAARKLESTDSDTNHNGRLDRNDLQALLMIARQIEFEERTGKHATAWLSVDDNYTDEDYRRELDGLGYDEILSLAKPWTEQQLLDARAGHGAISDFSFRQLRLPHSMAPSGKPSFTNFCRMQDGVLNCRPSVPSKVMRAR